MNSPGPFPDRPRPHGTRRALAAAILLWLTTLAAAAQPPPGRPTGPRLTDFWFRWAADLEPLMSGEERAAFFELSSNAARDSFAQAFWRSRGDAAAERWSRNREDVRRLALESTRRRVALLLGKPSRTESFPRCGGLRRLEVWLWDPPALAGRGTPTPGAPDSDAPNPDAPNPDAPNPNATAILVLARQTSFDARSLRPWAPGALDELTYAPRAHGDLESALAYAAGSRCFAAGQVDRLRELLGEASSFDELRRKAPWPAPADGWLDAWRRRQADATARDWPDARLELDFPGGFNDQTIVNGRIVIRSGRLHQLAPGQLFDRVTITGDVFRGDHLADSFEIVHHVAGAQAEPTLVLDFYRRLRPADYTLDLRAVDGRGQALLALRRDVRVPEAEAPARPPAGRARGYSHLTRPDVIELTTFPGVELLPASAQGGGAMRLLASTTGGPIDAVEFRLDGAPIGVDDDPPYTASIASGSGRRLAEAIALDPEGRPLAYGNRRLEPETRTFSVRFGEPAGDQVPVAVSVPQGAVVERLECLHGRQPKTTLDSPPWRCPLPQRFGPRVEYLAVRATLAGGEIAEDVLFLGTAAETVDVRLAELYLSVVDAQGRPVPGLGRADFRLRDRRGELPLDSVAELASLPLSVALLMDVSSSMGREVRVVAESAQRFFETVLEPGDLASLAAFNHDLHHLAPFTGDADVLRYASAGLRAGGSTRLHDAIIHALFQFSGQANRRALIVLSDGEDVGSDYPFEQVLDEAVRAGVAAYPVFLGAADATTRDNLERLAAATGGRSFAVRGPARPGGGSPRLYNGAARFGGGTAKLRDGTAELDRVLRQIADELRAQYLLVFRPRGRTRDLAFRQLEVDVLRPGLEARDVHGHYR